MKRIAFVVLSSFFLAVPVLWGAEPTGEATVSLLNRYLWRGYELSRDSAVVQPSLTLGYKGLTASFWGNVDTKTYAASGAAPSTQWNETDLTLSYTKDMGSVALTGGYIYYSLGSFDGKAPDRPDSQEVFASLAFNTPLNPTLTIYREIAHYRNWYFQLALSHLRKLSESLSLKVAATVGYLLSTDAATYPKFDADALATAEKFRDLHDGSLTVSLPIKLAGPLTVTPSVAYVFPLTKAAKNEIKGFGLQGVAPSQRDSSFLAAGIGVSLGF